MNLLEWLTDCGLDSSMEAFYYNGKDMNLLSSYSVHEVECLCSSNLVLESRRIPAALLLFQSVLKS